MFSSSGWFIKRLRSRCSTFANFIGYDPWWSTHTGHYISLHVQYSSIMGFYIYSTHARTQGTTKFFLQPPLIIKDANFFFYRNINFKYQKCITSEKIFFSDKLLLIQRKNLDHPKIYSPYRRIFLFTTIIFNYFLLFYTFIFNFFLSTCLFFSLIY